MLHHRIHHRGPDADWVVLVHGAGGSSAVWFRQIPAYSEEFNLLLVDLRGHGGSAAGAERREGKPYTFEDVSRDILEVLDHRGIERAHFVGISLGCLIIRTVAEIAPERVRSLVLAGAIGRLDLRSRVLVLLARALKRVVPFMWLYRLYAWILLPRTGHRESRLIFVREARTLARAEVLRWFGLTPELGQILRLFEERDAGIPTLYIMGEEDHMFLAAARHLARSHRRSAIRVIERCGHVCNIQEADVFNRLSIEFLKDPARASGSGSCPSGPVDPQRPDSLTPPAPRSNPTGMLLVLVLTLAACGAEPRDPPPTETAPATEAGSPDSAVATDTAYQRADELEDAARKVVAFLRGGGELDVRLADTVVLHLAPEGGGTRVAVARERLHDRSIWAVRGDRTVHSLVPPEGLTELTTAVGRHFNCLETPLSTRSADLAALPHVGTKLQPPGADSCLQTWNLTLVFHPNQRPPTLVAAIYDQWEW